MTVEEYEIKLEAIRNAAISEEKKLKRECAFSNNPYSIGDIIEDHIGKIRIEKIRWVVTYNANIPECVYTGIVLKKDGTPAKKEESRQIWQSNIRE